MRAHRNPELLPLDGVLWQMTTALRSIESSAPLSGNSSFVAGELKVIEPGWGAEHDQERDQSHPGQRSAKRNLNGMEITQIAAARFWILCFHSRPFPTTSRKNQCYKAMLSGLWRKMMPIGVQAFASARKPSKWEIGGT